MKFLKSEFEGQLFADIDDDGDVIVGGVPFSPAKILQIDSSAYEAAYEEWYSDTWLPEQEENLEKILQFHGNKKRFENLCEAISMEKVVPFIGSGMSVPMSLPTWTDFLRSICEYSKFNKEELEKLLGLSAFEEAVDALRESMPENLFDERIHDDLSVPSDVEMNGAVCLLPSIFNGLVLTTNLDNILEDLYEQNSCKFDYILIGAGISEYRTSKSPNRSFLLKLHGDRRTPKGRVLSKKEYDEVYEQRSTVHEELSLILRTNNLLFLGSSLGKDRTVKLIESVAKDDKNMPRHFAFLQSPPNDEQRLEKEHFLAERKISPIWYLENHDASITALFVGILKSLGKDISAL